MRWSGVIEPDFDKSCAVEEKLLDKWMSRHETLYHQLVKVMHLDLWISGPARSC
jgi:hypothetical protein